MKRDFEKESYDGTLGNPAATYVLDRLRPPYWFSAHMHCKFSALKTFPPPTGGQAEAASAESQSEPSASASASAPAQVQAAEPQANPDEIDLDMDDDAPAAPSTEEATTTTEAPSSGVADHLRAQLPASFSRPEKKDTPGQPVPQGITNRETRFLALDKCLPGRHFLQLCEINPLTPLDSRFFCRVTFLSYTSNMFRKVS